MLDVARIVGGIRAGWGEFPYFVHGLGCGGTLVAPDVVLTAAHCQGSFDYDVRVGSVYDSAGGQLVDTIKQEEAVHPAFENATLANDIMLVKLAKPVYVAQYASWNAVNGVPGFNSQRELTSVGFGKLSNGGPLSDTLQKVNLSYLNNDQCDELFSGTIHASSQLCAR